MLHSLIWTGSGRQPYLPKTGDGDRPAPCTPAIPINPTLLILEQLFSSYNQTPTTPNNPNPSPTITVPPPTLISFAVPLNVSTGLVADSTAVLPPITTSLPEGASDTSVPDTVIAEAPGMSVRLPMM